MRIALFFCLAFFLSCSEPSEIEKKIIAQLETVDGVRYDLKTKIISLDTLEAVTAADSLEVVKDLIKIMDTAIDDNLKLMNGSGSNKTREQLRAEMIPPGIDRKVAVYSAHPDSVLFTPYRVKVQQVVDGVRREFERVVVVR